MNTITITSIPQNIEQFVALRDKIAVSPEGGTAIFLLALKLFVENPELGNKCLVVAADRNNLSEGDVYKNFQISNSSMNLIKSQLEKNNKIPNSYISGSSPENNYSVNLPFTYNFTTNKYSGNESEGKIKLFVKCSGADSDRPVHLIKNNHNIWKMTNWSSILVGIKKPPVDDNI